MSYMEISLVMFAVCMLASVSMIPVARELEKGYREFWGDRMSWLSNYFGGVIYWLVCAVIMFGACMIPYFRWVQVVGIVLTAIALAIPGIRRHYINYCLSPFTV